MTDEDQNQSQTATLPPPDGEEDLYSASTAVGPASEELLALVRAAEGGAGSSKSEKGEKSPPPKAGSLLATPKEPASRADATEPPRPAKPATAAKAASDAPKPATNTPKPLPKLSTDDAAVPSETTARRRAVSSAPEGRRPAPGIQPFVSIVFMFLAAVLVLAALIR